MQLKTIKDVCRMCGVTEGALRYYDAKGVVSPVRKEETGRRRWLYDDATIETLKMLLLLRYIGLPLDEIKNVLEERERLADLLQEHLAKLRRKKARLDLAIFVAQSLIAAGGADVLCQDKDLGRQEASILDEVLRTCMKEGVNDEK